MIYIIDANNLAGKLEILFEDDFDQKFISIIKHHFHEKKIRVFLVFDSCDPMGDKFEKGNITVVYTPRDSYYKNADDKVIELLCHHIDNSKEEITVVTDDLEIIEKAEKIVKEKNSTKVFFKKATDFANLVQKKETQKQNKENEDERGLSDEQVDDINKELLNLWK